MTETETLLTHIRQCRRVDLYTQPLKLSPVEQNLLDHFNQRRNSGEPLQYILGETQFRELNLKTDRRALIPRPETELLVDLSIKKIQDHFGKKKLRILDIGTGSGNIAISLAKALPNSKITTVDICKDALSLACENAQDNDVQIEFIQEDFKIFSQNL